MTCPRPTGSVYLVSEPVGRGQVITFADDPDFRLFWRGTLPLFLNAVLYGPSFPRRNAAAQWKTETPPVDWRRLRSSDWARCRPSRAAPVAGLFGNGVGRVGECGA